ncbi:MAG: riboflavin kinase [Faecalibacterium sp.]
MGYFDGIHIGHRAVIDGAVQWARAHGAAPAVFTFRLPVDNKMKGKRLLSSADKHALIASLGVEYYLTPDFEEIKSLSPEQFVRSIVENCHAKALFCGENFTFGAKAAGTPERCASCALRWAWKWWWCPWHSLRKSRCPPPASAPRWRAATSRRPTPCWACPTPSALRCSTARAWATRWGAHHQPAVPQGFQMPRSGIYITRTLVNGTWYPSATGLGSRPTVNDDATKVTCETFIPGFSGDLYGTDPVVEFHAYLSPSKKFDTLDELRDCINNAAQRAQEYFK